MTSSTGNGVRLRRMLSRLLGRLGSRCWARTIGAGKSAGRLLTSTESASTPPAEEPTTTRSPRLTSMFLVSSFTDASSLITCSQVKKYVGTCRRNASLKVCVQYGYTICLGLSSVKQFHLVYHVLSF